MNTFQIEFIRREVPNRELLAQLAEEAAELAQAALKLRRALDNVNPTPVKPSDALEDLKEEVADVCLILHVLQIDTDSHEHKDTRAIKLQRWVDRIMRARKGGQA
jgi:NTP pyrophosphatase (non-canonical NTP hydrolase)